MSDAGKEILIIGNGLQGLSTAYLLAKEGVKVTIISPPSPALGALADEEFYEGRLLGACPHQPVSVSPSLLRKCNISDDQDSGYAIPLNNGDLGDDDVSLILPMAPGDAQEYFGENPDQYLKFWRNLGRIAVLLAGVLKSTPREHGKTWQDLYQVYSAANKLAEQDQELQKAFSELFTLSIVDYVDRYLSTESYKESVVSEVAFIVHSNPLAQGSAAGLLDLVWQSLGHKVKRLGVESLRQSLKSLCEEAGVVDKTILMPKEFIIEDGYVRGVITQDAQKITAARVICDMPVCQTFLDLMPDGAIAHDWRARIEGESKPSQYVRIKLSLKDFPQSILDDAKLMHTGYRLLGLNAKDLAASYSNALSGRISNDMLVQMALVDTKDGTPTDKVVSILGAYSNADLERSETNRVELARAIMGRLCSHYKGLDTSIEGFAVYMGSEIARMFGVKPRTMIKGGAGFSSVLSQTMFWKNLQDEHKLQNLYLVGQGAEATISYFNVNDPERITSAILSDLAI